MKKTTFYINISLLVLAAVIVIGFYQPDGTSGSMSENSITGSTNVSKIAALISIKKHMEVMKPVSLFEVSTQEANRKALNEFIREGDFLTLNRTNLSGIMAERPANIRLQLPMQNGNPVELELTQVSILTKNFENINSRTKETVPFSSRGLFYQGIIAGNDNSLAAISIFDDFVMGIISNENGNFVLGSMKDANNRYTDNYVYYNDKNIINQKPFVCGIGNNEDKFVMNNPNNGKTVSVSDNSMVSQDTIDVFFDTDYDMYVKSNQNLTTLNDFVSGFFNGVAAIYANENIPFKISRIGYNQSPDPYVNDSDSYVILSKFGQNTKDNFMGDLAHLLSTGHGGVLGGIAWINVLCTPAAYNNAEGVWMGRFAFSNIETSYNAYPTYSWTVSVVTHEMGHNVGSYHTHACHWRMTNGGIGPIDTCIVTGENSVQNGGCINSAPANACYQSNSLLTSGFIMSYCHFCVSNGGGINFNNGFGRPFNGYRSQSGDTIRLRYQLASCIHSNLNSSEIPAQFFLLQNYPNPYNPTTNIRFALPEEGLVTLRIYDITGREVTKLIDNAYYQVGLFSYPFDASAFGLASGVYLYKIEVRQNNSNVFSAIKKMVLVK